MKLVVNGTDVQVSVASMFGQLLVERQVRLPDMVSVELNGNRVAAAEFEATPLQKAIVSSCSISWEAAVDSRCLINRSSGTAATSSGGRWGSMVRR